MTFQEAVITVLTKKYADFSGRARRSEYWWFALGAFATLVVLSIVGSAIGPLKFLYYLAVLALIVPGIAAGVRRMHDTGRSGWFILVPIANIIWAAEDSAAGDNQYGPNPKAAAAPQSA